jgi:hypothetical protein
MITVPGNLLAALRDGAYNTVYEPCELICLLVEKANREERWSEFDKAFPIWYKRGDYLPFSEGTRAKLQPTG